MALDNALRYIGSQKIQFIQILIYTVRTVLEAAASILFERFGCGLYLRAASISNLPKHYVKIESKCSFSSKTDILSTELTQNNENAACI